MKRGFAAALAVLALDQASKELLRREIPLHESRELLPFFALVHVENTGAAFGMMRGANLFFILLSFVILAFLAKFGREIWAAGGWGRAGLPLVWGGALGNLIDRLRLGGVTDFLDFHAAGWHWPAFNVADSAISTGIVCLLIQNLLAKDAAKPAD